MSMRLDLKGPGQNLSPPIQTDIELSPPTQSVFFPPDLLGVPEDMILECCLDPCYKHLRKIS